MQVLNISSLSLTDGVRQGWSTVGTTWVLITSILAAAVLGPLIVGISGCERKAPTHGQGPKPIRVVTTFTILQDMAQNVAGDKALVESITKPGAEIHDYEPTPLDIVKAQAADLVLKNGMGARAVVREVHGQRQERSERGPEFRDHPNRHR